jgi:hypothetical protein
MADEDLERPPLVPRWVTAAVVVLAIIGLLSIVNWIVRFAFGVAKGLLLVLLVIGVVALVRAVGRRG